LVAIAIKYSAKTLRLVPIIVCGRENCQKEFRNDVKKILHWPVTLNSA
jgi:hypothetical protein